MKKFLALTCLSAAFLTSIGCQTPSGGGDTKTTPPPPKTSAAPASPASAPSAAPSAVASAAASAAPSAAASAAPANNASGAPAGMSPVRHPGTGLSFNVPSDWKQEPKNEDTMIVTSPDSNASLVIFVVPTSAAKKVGDEVDKQLSTVMTDIKMDDKTEKTETVNGLPQFSETGSAKLKQGNKPVDLAVWLVKGNGDKSLMVIGMGDLKGKDATVQAIRQSIHQGEASAAAPSGAPSGAASGAAKSGDDDGPAKKDE